MAKINIVLNTNGQKAVAAGRMQDLENQEQRSLYSLIGRFQEQLKSHSDQLMALHDKMNEFDIDHISDMSDEQADSCRELLLEAHRETGPLNKAVRAIDKELNKALPLFNT